MISLVPMAGKGSRFKQEGYNLPKPFIPILGSPMFVTSVRSFPAARKYVFLCLESFLTQYPFEREVQKYFPQSAIISILQVTEGQASTCLLAKDQLLAEEDLLISSIDYQVVYDRAHWEKLVQDESISVIIWTFRIGSISKKDPKAFAYCRIDKEGFVQEIVEKQTISDTPGNDPAVVGTFYYRNCKDFTWGAENMISQNIRVNNEFYVGTSINQLIKAGKKVKIFEVEKFISFGDPFELDLFHFWEEFFHDNPDHPYSG